MKYFPIIALILLPLASFAQMGYLPGHMISFSNDTIHTHIKVLNNKRLSKIGYINERGKKRKFSAKKIKEYTTGDAHHYFSIAPRHKLPKSRGFARIEINGQLRLLFYDYNKSYYLMQQGDVNAVKIPKLFFRKKIIPHIAQHKDLRWKIQRRKLKYQDLSVIIIEYNDWYNAFYVPYLETVDGK